MAAYDYLVRTGDCLSSIAFAHGTTWDAIWNHPSNRDLKVQRKDPNVLLAGDVVHIPEPQPLTFSLRTGKRHVIVVPGVRAKLRLRIVEPQPAPPPPAGASASPPTPAGASGDGGSPLGGLSSTVAAAAGAVKDAVSSVLGLGDPEKNVATEDPPYQPVQMIMAPRKQVPYRLSIGGQNLIGNTDDDGNIVAAIRPNARAATLVLDPGTPNERSINIKLGALDPADGVPGAKQRLANLGLECGDRTDNLTPDFARTLMAFQARFGLAETAALDGPTSAKLTELHGA